MRFRSCEGCFKPVNRRLATLQSKDFECYGDGYIKCFWNLCDHQHSSEHFLVKTENSVITAQPCRQELLYKTAA